MGRRKKDEPVVAIAANKEGASKAEVIEAPMAADRGRNLPAQPIEGNPPFGARVLVWDVRYDCWVCAYFCRVGNSNSQGRFEEWSRGESRVVSGDVWQYLPAKPGHVWQAHRKGEKDAGMD